MERKDLPEHKDPKTSLRLRMLLQPYQSEVQESSRTLLLVLTRLPLYRQRNRSLIRWNTIELRITDQRKPKELVY